MIVRNNRLAGQVTNETICAANKITLKELRGIKLTEAGQLVKIPEGKEVFYEIGRAKEKLDYYDYYEVNGEIKPFVGTSGKRYSIRGQVYPHKEGVLINMPDDEMTEGPRYFIDGEEVNIRLGVNPFQVYSEGIYGSVRVVTRTNEALQISEYMNGDGIYLHFKKYTKVGEEWNLNNECHHQFNYTNALRSEKHAFTNHIIYNDDLDYLYMFRYQEYQLYSSSTKQFTLSTVVEVLQVDLKNMTNIRKESNVYRNERNLEQFSGSLVETYHYTGTETDNDGGFAPKTLFIKNNLLMFSIPFGWYVKAEAPGVPIVGKAWFLFDIITGDFSPIYLNWPNVPDFETYTNCVFLSDEESFGMTTPGLMYEQNTNKLDIKKIGMVYVYLDDSRSSLINTGLVYDDDVTLKVAENDWNLTVKTVLLYTSVAGATGSYYLTETINTSTFTLSDSYYASPTVSIDTSKHGAPYEPAPEIGIPIFYKYSCKTSQLFYYGWVTTNDLEDTSNPYKNWLFNIDQIDAHLASLDIKRCVHLSEMTEITGLVAWNSKCVVLSATHLAMIQGERTLLIQPVVGCEAPNTIASTMFGVIWLGRDGIYLFNGSSVSRISKWLSRDEFLMWDKSDYRPFFSGVYDSQKNAYYLSLYDLILVLDLDNGNSYINASTGIKLRDLSRGIGFLKLAYSDTGTEEWGTILPIPAKATAKLPDENQYFFPYLTTDMVSGGNLRIKDKDTLLNTPATYVGPKQVTLLETVKRTPHNLQFSNNVYAIYDSLYEDLTYIEYMWLYPKRYFIKIDPALIQNKTIHFNEVGTWAHISYVMNILSYESAQKLVRVPSKPTTLQLPYPSEYAIEDGAGTIHATTKTISFYEKDAKGAQELFFYLTPFGGSFPNETLYLVLRERHNSSNILEKHDIGIPTVSDVNGIEVDVSEELLNSSWVLVAEKDSPNVIGNIQGANILEKTDRVLLYPDAFAGSSEPVYWIKDGPVAHGFELKEFLKLEDGVQLEVNGDVDFSKDSYVLEGVTSLSESHIVDIKLKKTKTDIYTIYEGSVYFPDGFYRVDEAIIDAALKVQVDSGVLYCTDGNGSTKAAPLSGDFEQGENKRAFFTFYATGYVYSVELYIKNTDDQEFINGIKLSGKLNKSTRLSISLLNEYSDEPTRTAKRIRTNRILFDNDSDLVRISSIRLKPLMTNLYYTITLTCYQPSGSSHEVTSFVDSSLIKKGEWVTHFLNGAYGSEFELEISAEETLGEEKLFEQTIEFEIW